MRCAILLVFLSLLGFFIQAQNTLTHDRNFRGNVACSPDGKHIASGTEEHVIKIWDIVSGECIYTLKDHSATVYSVAYSPNGKNIASGSADTTIKIWDTTTGLCLNTFSGHSNTVNCIKYSNDGKYLLTGSKDKTIKIWEIETGICIRTLNGHEKGILTVIYSPDEKYIVSESDDGVVKIWNVENGECISTTTDNNAPSNLVYFQPGNGVKAVKVLNVTLLDEIALFVSDKIFEWEKKGEFEKTNEYNNRVNDVTRKKKIQEYTKEISDNLKNKYLDRVLKNMKIKNYIADADTFLIELSNKKLIELKVPSSEAQQFKEQWSNMIITGDASLKQGIFELKGVVFKNPINSKAYIYGTMTPSSTNSQITKSSVQKQQNKIGIPLLTNNYEVTILSIVERYSVGSNFFNSDASEGALYVIVRYKYKNITKQPISAFDLPNITLLDPSGVQYTSDIDASSSYATENTNDEKILSNLNPGVTSSSAVVFEISKELWKAKGWSIRIGADKSIIVKLP